MTISEFLWRVSVLTLLAIAALGAIEFPFDAPRMVPILVLLAVVIGLLAVFSAFTASTGTKTP